MEDEVPVQVVPEDDETHQREAAFVASVMGGALGEALADAALLVGLLLTSGDPVEGADEGATPSARALR
ncbi:hypothetical protein ACWD7Y_04100 [Streptomyces drozdowiczii]